MYASCIYYMKEELTKDISYLFILPLLSLVLFLFNFTFIIYMYLN